MQFVKSLGCVLAIARWINQAQGYILYRQAFFAQVRAPSTICSRCSWLSNTCASSSPSGAISSAAAEGVGALRSATKSLIDTSISWPTAQTMGISMAAIARAMDSALKTQRSSMEPPPRVSKMTSGCKAAARSRAVENLLFRVVALDGRGHHRNCEGRKSSTPN